jgi:hypothetical protein
MALDADDRLRLDYEQTTQYLRTLIDVRFRLLAFVPTVTGVAVAIIGRPRPAAELLGVGILGLWRPSASSSTSSGTPRSPGR